MTVDLNTCVPGQKCVCKDGTYLTYLNKIPGNDRSHHVLLDKHFGQETYTNDGIYDLSHPDSMWNIVYILPMELTTSDKHPSVAWWDSCPWITDRAPTEADSDHLGQVIVQTVSKQGRKLDFHFMQCKYVLSGRAWIHSLDWQPPVLSNKEQALELLNKHKGVWVPTLEQWDVIRKGLTE